MILDQRCPQHNYPMVSNDNKPALIGKCVLKECIWGVLKSDPTEIQDISAYNDVNIEG